MSNATIIQVEGFKYVVEFSKDQFRLTSHKSFATKFDDLRAVEVAKKFPGSTFLK